MPRKSIILFLCLFLVLPVKSSLAAPIAEDLNAAVIYDYYRIGGDDPYNQGLSLALFTDQINEITGNSYNTVPLATVLNAQKSDTALPPRTIVLTFENFDSSFLKNVWPLLEEHKLPFVITLSAAKLDEAEQNGVSPDWGDVLRLKESPLVEFAMTPYQYRHNDDRDETSLSLNINRAKARFREKADLEPLYFSYPFGEYSPTYLDALSKQGFRAALTQVSGVTGSSTPRLLLPRFTISDQYADIERFRITSAALPLPVYDIQPDSIYADNNPPLLGFTVAKDISDSELKKIDCFASGPGSSDIKTQIISSRVEVRLKAPFDDNKGRINCTIPVLSQDDNLGDKDNMRWRWAGFQFLFKE